jgi:hypothetical protein
MSSKSSAMTISIVFNAPSLKKSEYFLIMENINQNLKVSTEQLGDIESAEIKLYDTVEDEIQNDKAASLNIKMKRESFMEYRVACSWDKVIADIFHSLIAYKYRHKPGLEFSFLLWSNP